MAGYTVDVKGITIANLGEMEPDGSIPNKYLLMRVSLSADHTQLSLRNLNDKFFDGKNIDSADAQQNLIAANLDNAQMYDGDAITATRDAVKTSDGEKQNGL
jgi:spermidine/putrescine-binding protein